MIDKRWADHFDHFCSRWREHQVTQAGAMGSNYGSGRSEQADLFPKRKFLEHDSLESGIVQKPFNLGFIQQPAARGMATGNENAVHMSECCGREEAFTQKGQGPCRKHHRLRWQRWHQQMFAPEYTVLARSHLPGGRNPEEFQSLRMKRLLFFVDQEPIDFIEHETSLFEQPQPRQAFEKPVKIIGSRCRSHQCGSAWKRELTAIPAAPQNPVVARFWRSMQSLQPAGYLVGLRSNQQAITYYFAGVKLRHEGGFVTRIAEGIVVRDGELFYYSIA